MSFSLLFATLNLGSIEKDLRMSPQESSRIISGQPLMLNEIDLPRRLNHVGERQEKRCL